MKQSQRIAKNISVMVLAELVGFGLNFIITVLIARYLGLIGFGNYSFVIAFVGVFQMIADSGLNNILIREIAVNRDNLGYQLGVTKSLIWVFSIIVFLLIVLIINIINPAAEIRNATYIMGIAVLATVHALGYSSVFRALEEMEYNAAGFILHKICLISLVVLVIKLRLGLREIAGAYLISNILLWFFYYVIVSRRYLRPRMVLSIKRWWYLISEAIPIGVASILRKISWQVDILILSAIGTATSVGLFSAPYKIIQSINLLPHTVSMPLFPFFSRLAKTSHKELFQTYEKSLKFMCLLSVPLVVTLATLSYSIVSLLFGSKFMNSYIALQILSITIIFLFPNAQFIYLFSALGKQRLYTVCCGISLVINVILDFILIPRFDFVGACLGTLIADISLFIIGIYFTKSISKDVSFIKALWKPLVSGALMAAVLYQFRYSSLWWILLGICAGMLVYILSNLILKTFSKSEMYAIREWFPSKRKAVPVVPGSVNEIKQ
jgi:O-antigen/teichoic acid export membrane protein